MAVIVGRDDLDKDERARSPTQGRLTLGRGE